MNTVVTTATTSATTPATTQATTAATTPAKGSTRSTKQAAGAAPGFESLPSIVPPGAALGVMGGGQLGRMFVHAAQQLGYTTVVLDADPHSPAGLVAHKHIRAGYLDDAGLAELADSCVAITTEFENVPAAALERLARTRLVAPGALAVSICQDRTAEKAHFERCGVPCAPYGIIASESDLGIVSDTLFPAILKTARLGYDGKGQIRVAGREELAASWAELKHATCVLERVLPLATEVSVIVARNADGEIVHFPVQQNLHRAGVLAVTTVPVEAVAPDVLRQAVVNAEQLASSMAYVGVLCVEFFVLRNGSLVANEMAPRPHNSGHYSIDACDVSQFELQVRALSNLPLVAPRQHSAAVMLNLLGDLWFLPAAPSAVDLELEAPDAGQAPEGSDVPVPAAEMVVDVELDAAMTEPRDPPWADVLAIAGVHLHLYGKTEARPGRKMGHLTVTAPSPTLARATARRVATILGIETF